MILEELLRHIEQTHASVQLRSGLITISVQAFRLQAGALLRQEAHVTFWPEYAKTVGKIEINKEILTLVLCPLEERLFLMLDRNEQVLDMLHVPPGANSTKLLENYVTAIRYNSSTNVTSVQVVCVEQEVSI